MNAGEWNHEPGWRGELVTKGELCDALEKVAGVVEQRARETLVNLRLNHADRELANMGFHVSAEMLRDTAIRLRSRPAMAIINIESPRDLPIGTIREPFRGEKIDENVDFPCDGRPVSKSLYPALYEVVGDEWAQPGDDNPYQFRIPDMRDRQTGILNHVIRAVSA